MNKKEVLEYIVENIKGPDQERLYGYYIGNISYNFNDYIDEVDKKIKSTEELLKKYKKYKNNFNIVKDSIKSGEYDVDYDVVLFLARFVYPPVGDYNFITYSGYGEISRKRQKIAEIEKEIEDLEIHGDFEESLNLFKKE